MPTGGAGGNCIYCVQDCDAGLREVDELCADGTPTCPEGSFPSDTCSDQACAVTWGYCCDLTTGLVTENPCGSDGSREACPSGTTATFAEWCIPESLDTTDCGTLNGDPCLGDAQQCLSYSGARTTCECVGEAADEIWSCASDI